MQDRLDRMPEAMGVRRQTVEHPFGTLKAWMGATHFLTRTLDKVRTEMSLHVLAYNKAGDRDHRCGTADGGDQNLIASRKPRVPIDQRAPRPSSPGNTAPRPPPIARFSTASVDTRRSGLARFVMPSSKTSHLLHSPRRSTSVSSSSG